MRELKHPIALFLIAVLVVIGIGVGVVAATTHEKIYGPPWGRFTVAFPGRVFGYHGAASLTSGGRKFPFFEYANRIHAWHLVWR